MKNLHGVPIMTMVSQLAVHSVPLFLIDGVAPLENELKHGGMDIREQYIKVKINIPQGISYTICLQFPPITS